MPINVIKVRKVFPATERLNYLFNGGICLCPTVTQEALRNFIVEIENGYSDENWEKWTRTVSETYQLFGNLIGANTEEIVGIPNTSTGTGVIANLINPKPGSNIVLDDLEYNTVYPFTIREKSGVEIRIVRNVKGSINIRDFESLVDANTAAIVVSSVSCWNGYRYNLKELSEITQKYNAYLVVDAAQHVGAVQFDVERDNIDFLATCGHKWLLAPPGTGFLYIRKNHIEKFDPLLPGWMSTVEPWESDIWQPEFSKTAKRFETGIPNFMLLAAAKAGIQLISKLGISNIEEEILRKSEYLIEKLQEMGVKVYTPLEKEHRAGLVTFLVKKHEPLYQELLKNSIITGHLPNTIVKSMGWPSGGLRVDPTFFNTMEELDDLIHYIKKFK
jgi:selenocysteine lyase/cysteine desulfurase